MPPDFNDLEEQLILEILVKLAELFFDPHELQVLLSLEILQLLELVSLTYLQLVINQELGVSIACIVHDILWHLLERFVNRNFLYD